jgi:hypothetical protein
MEPAVIKKKRKGGRPKKSVKQSHFIGVKCTLIEKTILKQKAKKSGMKISEYLRDAGLKDQKFKKNKILPREVLQYTGTLNHIAANLNQLAKKRNQLKELDKIDQNLLEAICTDLKNLASQIKTYLQ